MLRKAVKIIRILNKSLSNIQMNPVVACSDFGWIPIVLLIETRDPSKELYFDFKWESCIKALYQQKMKCQHKNYKNDKIYISHKIFFP